MELGSEHNSVDYLSGPAGAAPGRDQVLTLIIDGAGLRLAIHGARP